MIYIIVAASILIATIILIHNRIRSRKNAVRRSWSDVLAYERQKNQVLPKLESLLQSYKGFEADLLSQITRLRTSLSHLGNEPDAKALAVTEQQSAALFEKLRMTVEAYPNLESGPAVRDVMTQLASLHREVTAALSIFNRNVELFNTGLEVFPSSLVNALVTKEVRVLPFTDTAAAAAFEYSPGL